MTTNNTKTAIYCRLACADDMRMEAQRKSLLQFAKSQGCDEVSEYSDNGKIGTTLDRPGFNQLTEEMRAGRVKLIFMRDISRIARNDLLTNDWLEQARMLGVEVMTKSDGNITTSTTTEQDLIDKLQKFINVYCTESDEEESE